MRALGLLEKRPGLLVPLALACGLGLMCALVAYGIKVNYGHQAVRFNAAAASLRDQLSRRLTAAHESIFGLAALFNASTSVNVEEFRVVGTDMLSRLDHIQSLQYMPRVTPEQRQAFERAMQEDGYLNYLIWPAKHTRPDSPAYMASQFPVRYVEPFTPSSVVELGFDILSDPALAKAAAIAVDTTQVVLVTRAWNSETRSLMLLKALYMGTAPPDLLAARRTQVSGLLSVRVGLHELLDTLSRLPMMHMRLTMTKGDGPPRQALYETPPTAVPDSLFSLPSLQTHYQLRFPEHSFQLTFSQPVSWAQVWYGPVWVVLMTGLFLTGLLYVTARSLAHRANDLQQRNLVIAEVVERQTAELQQDKDLLEQEVEVRRAAEYRLQQQQSALLGLATREAMVDTRLDSVLGNICQAAAGTLAVDRVSIWLFNDDGSELHCVALCEWGEQRLDIEAPVLRIDQAPAFFATVQGARVIAAENARADVRTRELRHDYLDPLGISALLQAPVRRAGIIGGVVCHEHLGGPRHWFLDEQGFANSVADMVTLALEMEDRRQTESEMIKLSRALENTADSVFITDREGVIEYVNTAFVQTTGYSRDEVLGLTPRVVRSGRHPNSFYERLWRCILGGQDFREVMVNRRKDGSLYYEEKTITPLRDGRGEITHFVSTGKDITERMETQEHLHFLAHHDVLTELPNRTLFIDRLDHAILQQRRNGRRLAVLFLDLDRFKNINDTLGHEAGDRLLQTVASRLLGCVRSVDTVARLGGDEFTLLIEDLDDGDGDSDSHSAERVAQKVLLALAEPIELYDHELYVTTSIGVAVYPTDGEDPLTLLKHADTAMYKAKENGRNTFYFYTAGMSSRAAARLTLEASMRRALERGEFVLHYQPQLDIRSGAVVAVEALLRWQKPGDGMIPPDDFIPLLEDTGLIVPVGEWVLRTACTQVRLWQSQQVTGLRMAVNLSARQFSDPELASRIEQILGETACEPALLDLEITESVIMEQADAAVQVMQRLRSLGVRVAIDDFGTGYSSLSYLKRFPIHTLKVDRSFIRDITEDPDDAAIVQSVVAMAHALKLEVVAEGVETAHQAAFLRDCHCDTVQGYLYARPMTADDLTVFIADLPRPVKG